MKSPPRPSTGLRPRMAAALIAACAAGPLVFAQTGSPASGGPTVMNPFEVSENSPAPYLVTESTAGGRVAVNLFDAQQSIIVVTSQLAQDLGAYSPLQSLQYFPGVGRGPEPEGSGTERIEFRGFQIINSETDGVDDANGDYFNRNQMAAMLDRIEVVMGTDSILNPEGVPGGTLNFVTKKPEYSNFGYVQGDWGRWNTDQVSFDINRVLTQNVAVRVITDAVNEDDYGSGDQRGFDTLAEASWKFGNGSVATLQYLYSWGQQEAGNQVGIPIDPSAGTLTYASLLQGLNPDAADILDDNMFNRNNRGVLTFLYSGNINDHLSVRFAARAEGNNELQLYASGVSAVNGTGGSYNPLTGDWTPGYTYGGAPTFTPIPIPAANEPGALYNATYSWTGFYIDMWELQNDYVYQCELNGVDSQTMAGVALNITKEVSYGFSYSPVTFNIFANQPIPLPNLNAPIAAADSWTSSYSNFANMYLSEVLKFLNGRLSIGASAVKDMNYLSEVTTGYQVKGVPVPFSAVPCPWFYNYGATFKVTPDVAVYYGHSESATPSDATPNANPYVDETTGRQDEEGIRMKALNDRLMATVCYYQIVQNNYSVINPANEVSPAPVPALPGLLLDRSDRGWEYGVNGEVTDNLSVILSYTNFRNRDPNGIPIRGEPENSGSGWLHYQGNSGMFKNWGFGVGYVHEGKVGAVTATGVTSASTPTNLIPNQQTFYLPSNGIWNVTASYKWGPWTVRGFIDNVFDKAYLASSINRDGVWPGTPFNPRVSIRYSF